MPNPGTVETIERALTSLRRSASRRRLQRRSSPDVSLELGALFMVLDALDEQEGLGVTQVAGVIAVDQPRASKLVARAVEEGLVSRSRAKPDGRKQELRLTASGRRIVEEAHRVRREAVAATLAGFSEEEAATFAELLSRFVDRW